MTRTLPVLKLSQVTRLGKQPDETKAAPACAGSGSEARTNSLPPPQPAFHKRNVRAVMCPDLDADVHGCESLQQHAPPGRVHPNTDAPSPVTQACFHTLSWSTWLTWNIATSRPVGIGAGAPERQSREGHGRFFAGTPTMWSLLPRRQAGDLFAFGGSVYGET